MSKENKKVDINKHEIDIDTLKKQNVNDLLSIKELYNRIEELQEKITQIKYIDNTIVKKIKKEYNNLKKIILDENIQVKLNNDIETINSQMDIKANKSDIETINSQMDIKANKSDIETINSQMDTMVIDNNGYLNVKKYMELNNKTLLDILNQGFKKIYFEKDGKYKITEPITLSEVYIIGDNANIMLEYNNIIDQGFVKLDNIHQLEGVNFICEDSEISPLIRIVNSNNLLINNISVTQNVLTNKSAINSCVDVFSNNNNLTFSNCTFNQFNQSNEGGIWVREGAIDGISSNITFKDCSFNQKGSNDEILAIWGWQGEVKNIIVESCKFIIENTNGYCASYVFTLGQSGKVNNVIFRNNVIECGELRHSIFRVNEIESSSKSINKNISIENNSINIYSSNPNYNRRIVSITKSNVDNYISTEIKVEFSKNNVICNCDTNRPFTGLVKCENNIINLTNTSVLFTNCDKIINNIIHVNSISSSIFEQCKYMVNNNIFVLNDGTYYLYYSNVDLTKKGLTSVSIINNNFNILSTCNLKIFTSYIDVLIDKNYITGNLNFFQCRENSQFIVTNNNFKTGASPSSNATVKLYKNNIIDNTLIDDKLIVT